METRPVLSHYSADKIAKIDATMSQIQVLTEIIGILAPLKEQVNNQAESLAFLMWQVR